MQNLNGPADLVVATDDRIELALTGTFGQIHRVLGERFAVGFALLIGDRRTSAHGVNGGLKRLALQSVFCKRATRRALVIGQCKQEKLAGNVGVTALGGLLVGSGEDRLQVTADLDIAFRSLNLRQALDGAVERGQQAVDRHAGTRKETAGAAFGIGNKRRKHMHRLNVRVVVACSETLSVAERLLELRGQFVKSHDVIRSGWLLAVRYNLALYVWANHVFSIVTPQLCAAKASALLSSRGGHSATAWPP